ncbi:MAG: ribose 5-phosphate isomerase B [Saccharofermentanales bacterium]|jgi:ribose 5-phosphate isomerase B|nr:ribose 5-phosphate isomerase B [Clostridiaceae bacterium]
MKLVVASDHGGFSLKQAIIAHLQANGHEIIDAGTNSEESVDYAIYAKKAASLVASGACERGIVVCGTGIGISISANKIHGIRCALCTNEFMTKMARRHNNANMLAMGARVLAAPYALTLVDLFLEEPFEGGRHQRRIDQIAEIERGD